MIRSTTHPGDALHLFADESSPAVATTAVTTPTEVSPEPAPAFHRRAELREERARLVADLARSTRWSHREVNALVNRQVGIRCVGDATAEELERSVAYLAGELARPG